MINWEIVGTRVVPVNNGQEDIIKVVYWKASRVFINNGKHYLSVKTGSATLPDPTTEFIPFESLSSEQLLNWVWANGVDKAAVESELLSSQTFTKIPAILSPI